MPYDKYGKYVGPSSGVGGAGTAIGQSQFAKPTPVNTIAIAPPGSAIATKIQNQIQGGSGWVKQGNGEWTWQGDPSIHGIGETQGTNFDPRSGANYDPSKAQFFPVGGFKAATTPDPYGGAASLVREMTARRLALLRQGLQGQQRESIAALRRQLASRNALDSGSLPAGTVDIGNHIADLLSRGTQEATIGENATLLDFLKARQQRNFEKEAQQAGFSHQEYMARLLNQFQRDQERDNRPSWWEQLLGIGGNIAGTAGGIALGKAIS